MKAEQQWIHIQISLSTQGQHYRYCISQQSTQLMLHHHHHHPSCLISSWNLPQVHTSVPPYHHELTYKNEMKKGERWLQYNSSWVEQTFLLDCFLLICSTYKSEILTCVSGMISFVLHHCFFLSERLSAHNRYSLIRLNTLQSNEFYIPFLSLLTYTPLC